MKQEVKNPNSKKQPQEILVIKKELQEVFNIYLETDVAGDNSDRNNKLYALSETFLILDNL